MTDPHPGAIPPSQPPAQDIPNYLVQSILVTIFCCMPLGVAAIIFSTQVNSKLQAGDVAGAMDASSKAKMFCWISFASVLVLLLIWLLFMALGFGFAVSSAPMEMVEPSRY